jgi:hypothetical protein
MKRTRTALLAVIILSGCHLFDQSNATTPAGEQKVPDSVEINDSLDDALTLPLTDYPPSDTPYHIENGDLWLVNTLEGHLFAFAPVSPEYAAHISVDVCRFAWIESVKRFVDPCSGDEWELNGLLNLDHSTELWSSRDLDQYALTVDDGLIYVHLGWKLPGAVRIEPPPT